MKKLVFILLIILSFTGCMSDILVDEVNEDQKATQATSEEVESLDIDWLTYTDENTGLSFKYPADYNVDLFAKDILDNNPELYKREYSFSYWLKGDFRIIVKLQRFDMEEMYKSLHLEKYPNSNEYSDYHRRIYFEGTGLLNKCSNQELYQDLYIFKDCKNLTPNITTYLDSSNLGGLLKFYFIETNNEKWPVATVVVHLLREKELEELGIEIPSVSLEELDKFIKETSKELIDFELNEDQLQIIKIADEMAKSIEVK